MKKKKLIKYLIVICLVLIFISFSNISNATLECTEEKLKNALDNVCGYEKKVTSQNKDGTETFTKVSFKDVTYQIDTDKKSINLNIEDLDSCIINYNLEKINSPEFTYNLIYRKDMDAEKVGKEYVKGEYIASFLFTVVSNVEGILPEDAMTVILPFDKIYDEILKNLIQIQEDFSDGVVTAKKMYDNNNLNISNEYIEVKYVEEDENEEEYKVKAIMKFNENANFSTMEGSAIKEVEEGNIKETISDNITNVIVNNIIETMVNTMSSSMYNVSDTNTIISQKKDDDVVAMANKLLKENEKNTGTTYSSTPKYPNAGLETNIFVPIIKILIGLLVISLIFMIVKVRKNKKIR